MSSVTMDVGPAPGGSDRVQATQKTSADAPASLQQSHGDHFAKQERPLGRFVLLSSRATHDRISRHAAAQALLGDRPHAVYRRLVADKLVYYTALEKQISAASHTNWMAPFASNAVRRRHHLQNDLQALDAVNVAPSEAAKAYARYLETLASRPDMLAVHAFLNYLGELHGGQIIGTNIRRHGLPATGLTFENSAQLLRQLTGCLTMTSYPSDLVHEADKVYHYSLAMFDAASKPQSRLTTWVATLRLPWFG